MQATNGLPCTAARGFTLYEVLLATAILALGLLGSLSLFPKALQIQGEARQRLLAATVAADLVTRYATGFEQNAFPGWDDYPLVKSLYAPDLMRIGVRDNGFAYDEGKSTKSNEGEVVQASTDVDHLVALQGSIRDRSFEPVPPEILRRLESERDEIRSLVEAGSPIYYLRPVVVNNSVVDGDDLALGSQASDTLIFGVVGYAQMNAHFHNPSEFRNGIDADPEHKSAYWRRMAKFDDGVPRWRSNFFDLWRFGKLGGGKRVDTFKYYFWDYEVQELFSYRHWAKTGEQLGGGGDPYPADPRSAFFDPVEDTDTAFPLLGPETNSLFMPFAPDERCRELVFWSVPWKSYADSERVPAADVDAAMYTNGAIWGGADDPQSSKISSYGRYERWWKGTSNRDWERAIRRDIGDEIPTQTGHYWDRNFNEIYDSGAVPPTVRMRAKTVARFLYYDRRLYTQY